MSQLRHQLVREGSPRQQLIAKTGIVNKQRLHQMRAVETEG
jgi:hypothetical protein